MKEDRCNELTWLVIQAIVKGEKLQAVVKSIFYQGYHDGRKDGAALYADFTAEELKEVVTGHRAGELNRIIKTSLEKEN